MAPGLGNLARSLPARAAGSHELARGRSFRVEDCVCCSGVRAPVSERQHPRSAIAVMIQGTFHVRASQGEVLLGPGALLLKSAATTHEYRHVADGGDRTIVFEYDEPFLEEARAAFAPRRRARPAFDALAIPPAPQTAAAVALTEHALRSGEPAALEDAAMSVAAAALAADAGRAGRLAGPAPAHLARVARTLGYIEAHHGGDCALEALAAHAGLSPFHYARTFRALTGQTPRQHVIATRLRAAAASLRASRAPILEVALDAGFGDLSHFTTSFRRAFGVSPRVYRRRHAR